MIVGIIGNGNVGSALQRGLSKAGHDARAVGHEPAAIRELAGAADVVILAVPFAAVDEVVGVLSEATDGKVVVDVTNALTPEYRLAVGFDTSGAEELQKKLPAARVVKAFNTVFAQHMDSGRINGEPLAALVAADDAAAKATVLGLATAIGFDAIDAGGLQNARLLEPMALQNIALGYLIGMGPNIGFALLRN